MNRRSYWCVPAFIVSTLIFSTVTLWTGCGGSSKKTPPPPVVAIAATSGTPQSAAIGTAFAAPLTATVTTGGTPTSGVSVTFTAPASGASGTFATTTPGATDTEVTNASGVATSQVFTANTTAGAYTVTASATGATSASFSLTNTTGAAANLTATSGSGQSAKVGTAFANPLVATVTDSGGNGVMGVSVTFTAPAVGASGLFADGGTPAITDTEVTDASGNATSTVFTANAMAAGPYNVVATSGTLTPVNFALTNTALVVTSPLPDGNYVYTLAGTDNVDFSHFDVAGVFTIAGGVITGGEQDFIDFNFALTDSINPTGSSVVTSADGNVLITLVTCNAADCTATDANIGVAGIETLNGALVSSSKARITEFDASASASGTLRLQTSTTATFPESYAFTVSGIDTNGNALAIGGIINVDGASGTISGANSIFDANDGGSGTTFQGETFGAGSVSAPDAFGRIVFTLNPTDSTDFPQILLVGYIVDNTHIQLVEADDASVAATGGQALSQGANTGTFSSASVSGNSYVAGVNGFDTTGVLQAAALLTFNSGGTVGGTTNGNDLTGGAGATPSPITAGTYTVDSTGRVTLTGVTAAGGAINTNLQLYLDGSGDVLVLALDVGDELAGVGSQQTGGGSFTAANLSGTYVVSATGADFNFEDELDAAGQVSADGVGILGATVGYVDLNWLFDPSPGPVFTDAPVTGTFTADPSGVFTGTFTGLDVTSCPAYTGTATTCTVDTFAFYLLDASGDAVVIETDSNQLTLGLFDLQ